MPVNCPNCALFNVGDGVREGLMVEGIERLQPRRQTMSFGDGERLVQTESMVKAPGPYSASKPRLPKRFWALVFTTVKAPG